jgi:hypothetical protein
VSEFLLELELTAVFDESGVATTISPQQRPGSSHDATDYGFVDGFLLAIHLDSSQTEDALSETCIWQGIATNERLFNDTYRAVQHGQHICPFNSKETRTNVLILSNWKIAIAGETCFCVFAERSVLRAQRLTTFPDAHHQHRILP